MRVGWDFRNRNSSVKVASSVSLTRITGRLWCGFHSTTTKYAECRGDVIVFCAQKLCNIGKPPFPLDSNTSCGCCTVNSVPIPSFTHTLLSSNSIILVWELEVSKDLLGGGQQYSVWIGPKSFITPTWLNSRSGSLQDLLEHQPSLCIKSCTCILVLLCFTFFGCETLFDLCERLLKTEENQMLRFNRSMHLQLWNPSLSGCAFLAFASEMSDWWRPHKLYE